MESIKETHDIVCTDCTRSLANIHFLNFWDRNVNPDESEVPTAKSRDHYHNPSLKTAPSEEGRRGLAAEQKGLAASPRTTDSGNGLVLPFHLWLLFMLSFGLLVQFSISFADFYLFPREVAFLARFMFLLDLCSFFLLFLDFQMRIFRIPRFFLWLIRTTILLL